MKNYVVKITMLILISLSLSAVTQAQFVVKVRPAAPALKVRPVCKTPGHVWVGGNYVRRGNQYVYTNGYWAAPVQGHRWVDGYWKQRRGGWIWIPGYWRR